MWLGLNQTAEQCHLAHACKEGAHSEAWLAGVPTQPSAQSPLLCQIALGHREPPARQITLLRQPQPAYEACPKGTPLPSGAHSGCFWGSGGTGTVPTLCSLLMTSLEHTPSSPHAAPGWPLGSDPKQELPCWQGKNCTAYFLFNMGPVIPSGRWELAYRVVGGGRTQGDRRKRSA